MLIWVKNDYGDFVDTFERDETRSTPRTWFVPPDIVV